MTRGASAACSQSADARSTHPAHPDLFRTRGCSGPTSAESGGLHSTPGATRAANHGPSATRGAPRGIMISATRVDGRCLPALSRPSTAAEGRNYDALQQDSESTRGAHADSIRKMRAKPDTVF